MDKRTNRGTNGQTKLLVELRTRDKMYPDNHFQNNIYKLFHTFPPYYIKVTTHLNSLIDNCLNSNFAPKHKPQLQPQLKVA